VEPAKQRETAIGYDFYMDVGIFPCSQKRMQMGQLVIDSWVSSDLDTISNLETLSNLDTISNLETLSNLQTVNNLETISNLETLNNLGTNYKLQFAQT
jgi:hypothetical protein